MKSLEDAAMWGINRINEINETRLKEIQNEQKTDSRTRDKYNNMGGDSSSNILSFPDRDNGNF